MLSDSELIGRLDRLSASYGDLDDWLGDDPGATFKAIVRPKAASNRAMAIVGPRGEGAQGAANDAAFEAAGAGAKSALKKLKRHGAKARFEAAERDGVEAIIVFIGRPAILIQDGKFFPPPKEWARLEDHRAEIETCIASVGRIEVDGHPAKTWIGTGFVVAPGVVVTNRHVVKEFARTAARGRWQFEPGMRVRIDFAEEFGENVPREFAVKEILGVSDDYDLALLRTAERGKAGKLPPPLPITAAPRGGAVKGGRDVYAIGFPAMDTMTGDFEIQRQIFQGIYNVKRLQPGSVMKVKPRRLFEHDCSTLGGNSGSCVVDLETHRVVGLHFRGRYAVANKAVNLTLLSDYALLRRAGVDFQ